MSWIWASISPPSCPIGVHGQDLFLDVLADAGLVLFPVSAAQTRLSGLGVPILLHPQSCVRSVLLLWPLRLLSVGLVAVVVPAVAQFIVQLRLQTILHELGDGLLRTGSGCRPCCRCLPSAAAPGFSPVARFLPGYGTNSTTPLVKKIAQNGVSFEYEYDTRGNITSEKRGDLTTTYQYDALGQLVRVNDPHENATWVYNYDRGGNITSKVKYAYTTGRSRNGRLKRSPTSTATATGKTS